VIWITVATVILCFVLAVIIARLTVRKVLERQGLFAIIVLLCFFLMITLSNQYLLPEINIWREQRDIEQSLKKIAAYEQIARSEPETYARMKAEIKKSLRSGESKAHTSARIRRIVNELVGKYLPRASDDAIFGYVSVMVRELEELTRINPELSYQFLFPQKGGAISHAFHLSPEMKKADLDALAEVIRTGSTSPVVMQDFSEARALLEKAFANLYKAYGKDILLLKNPLAPGIYKDKYCNITIALFHEIFKLPKQQSCLVLRYMFSNIHEGAQ